MVDRKQEDLDADQEELEDGDGGSAEDVSRQPGPTSDTQDAIDRYISSGVRKIYDVYSYRHAAAILSESYSAELREIEQALLKFRITQLDIGLPGGNESTIPPKFSSVLRPAGWIETRIQGDLLVRRYEYDEIRLAGGKTKKRIRDGAAPIEIANYIDGHKIDYVKNRVAFDLEWNSKDQTFDRDLFAFRVFHECGLISVGVIVTRSESLNPLFEVVPRRNKNGEVVTVEKGKNKGQIIPVKAKYGASTTWIGKLLYRLNAGRQGGCPVLVFGITPRIVTDWRTP